MKSLLIVIFAVGALSCGSTQTPETVTPEQVKHDEKGHESGASHNHQNGDEPTAGPETGTSDVLANDGTRNVGDVTTCPVTKDVFKISSTSPNSTVDGKTYYFCCKGCIRDFAADPSKFLSLKSDEHKHGDDAH